MKVKNYLKITFAIPFRWRYNPPPKGNYKLQEDKTMAESFKRKDSKGRILRDNEMDILFE